MKLIVCFSGRIGSGKSSLSRAVSNQLGCPRASFGDYLRNEVSRHGGDPSSRQTLQDLGEYLVNKNVNSFCRQVFEGVDFSAVKNLVVDGVRHVSVYNSIVSLHEDYNVKLIYLFAEECERYVRVGARGDAQSDFKRAEDHPVEAEMRDVLPTRADLILDSNSPFDAVLERALIAIQGWSR